jgi:aspartate/methionine/tyrosine aminotransferase
MDSGMFLGLQKAAVQALRQPDSWFKTLNSLYKDRREKAFAILELLDCTYSTTQVGLFVWAKVPDHIESVEKWIDEILYATKVFITPGFIFGNQGDRFIRISLCSTVAQLEEAHQRIAGWMQHAIEATVAKNEIK